MKNQNPKILVGARARRNFHILCVEEAFAFFWDVLVSSSGHISKLGTSDISRLNRSFDMRMGTEEQRNARNR